MKPWIGVALISLEINGSDSLKDRRQVVRSLLDRLKGHFNVSVADLGPEDSWSRADIAVSCIGSSLQEMTMRVGQLCSNVEHAEEAGEFAILDIQHEVFAYGDF
jgi:uncharacterized protein YlxP (DUF503 family)